MSYTNGLDKPSDYFDTVIYSGNGGTQSITSLDFQPDFLWGKQRNEAQNNRLIDSVRGNTKEIFSDLTTAEQTLTNGITAFNSNGFGLGSSNGYNKNSGTYVTWNWKAETSFTNDASATGIGTIDSTGSVNTDAGFSIISWTGDGNNGATIAHGLGVTPAIVITKRRSAVGDWLVGGSTINTAGGGSNKLLLLNTSAAIDTNSEVYQTFSSTTFQVGVNAYANTSGSTMISYCFAEKSGYSSMGQYTGNGNADGTFVYTGFKPAWVLTKKTSGTSSWIMMDNKRNTYNVMNKFLDAYDAGAEGSLDSFDFLSNGFKLRTSNGDRNASGDTYIYACFAENPFVTSTGVPATAR